MAASRTRKRPCFAISSSQSTSPDMSEALSLFSSLRAIADDAQSKCDLDLGIPML